MSRSASWPGAAAALMSALLACGPGGGSESEAIDPGGEPDRRYGLFLEVAEPAGHVGRLRIRVEPRSGWHLATEAPARLELSGPSGVDFQPASQRNADAVALDEGRLEFATGFQSDDHADVRAQGHLRFGICEDGDASCAIVRRDLDFRIGRPR